LAKCKWETDTCAIFHKVLYKKLINFNKIKFLLEISWLCCLLALKFVDKDWSRQNDKPEQGMPFLERKKLKYLINSILPMFNGQFDKTLKII
jgi:hypothetical protein